MPAVCVRMCCSVISRSAGINRTPAPRGSLGMFQTATFGFLNSGMNFDTGSFSTSLPSSISIRMATAVMGLVIDARRNKESVRSAISDSKSVVPCASKWTTLPLRATSVTTPLRSFASMWPLISGRIRLRRSAEKPTSSRLERDTCAAAACSTTTPASAVTTTAFIPVCIDPPRRSLSLSRSSAPARRRRRRSGGTTAVGCARRRNHVLVLEPLAELRIHRLRPAEHRFDRDVALLGELVDEGILSRQIVRHQGQILVKVRQLLDRLAGRRGKDARAARIELERRGQDVGLRKNCRILHDAHHGQDVSVANEVLGDRRFVAVESTMTLDVPNLEMCRVYPERVAFPGTGREAAMRMRGVLGRMRPAVHPDCRRVAIDPSGDVPRDELLCNRIGRAGDLQAEWAGVRVERRVHLTLTLSHRQGGNVVAQSFRTPILVERHAEVIN